MDRSGDQITIDLQLLADACRADFLGSAASLDAPEVDDWVRLERLAERHRVQGFFAATTRIAAPADVAAALAERERSVVADNLRALAEMQRIAEEFAKAGVDLLFVKGLTLAALIYEHPLRKVSSDIDILVEPAAITDAGTLLERLGYRLATPAPLVQWHRRRKESVWVGPHGQTLDLHSRLADNRLLVPAVGMASERQRVAIASGLEVETLATAPLFAYLCVHGASSAWFRLKWVADLAGLLASRRPEEIDRLYRGSLELGAARAAGQALLVAAAFFPIALSPSLRDELRSDRAIRSLADTAVGELRAMREPTVRMFGTRALHWSQLGLRGDLRFKAAELRRQVDDAWLNRSGGG